MSLAVAETHLFIATQCGGSHDPLYVIDTRSDRIVRRLPGFAVGHTVAVTPNAGRVMVSTGKALHIIRDYMANEPTIQTIRRQAGRMALAPDGRLLLVASGESLLGVDILRATECKRAQLESEPQAIAVSPDGAVYAMLPKRLFVTDAQALACQ
jgi:DNA-binding beta-propeller fold protein YncE